MKVRQFLSDRYANKTGVVHTGIKQLGSEIHILEACVENSAANRQRESRNKKDKKRVRVLKNYFVYIQEVEVKHHQTLCT